MPLLSRRSILRASLAGATASILPAHAIFAYIPGAAEVPAGDRPPQDASVSILHARSRIPLSFIIDDSTCLVNMGHFCMPQFKAAWPTNPIYRRPWKDWPREIPDSFVREFGEWCAGAGVRGKYSLVPYPACVGWLDRDLPGWSKAELADSLKLVREVMVPNWDITPEMATHTRMIDLKTGRPFAEMNSATMENSWPPEKKSTDEMAAYIAYALNILKNAEIPAMGVTTPGGFGNKAKSELSLGIRQALTDVFKPEIPHYFKYIVDGKESALPRLEHVENVAGGKPKLVVNVPAGIGDHFGGWDGDRPPEPDKYLTEDGSAGRLKELIDRNEPAIMFGHWAGIFSNGTKAGFIAVKRIVTTLNKIYGDRTLWMTTGELARYQAARELTRIDRKETQLTLTAPFACPNYTIKISGKTRNAPAISFKNAPLALEEVKAAKELKAGTFLVEEHTMTVCFNLDAGTTTIDI